MKIKRQDLINKVETLIGEIKTLSKYALDRSYYNDLTEEASEWIEEIRTNEVEFIND